MPLYEYQCQSCQRAFELLVRGGEQPQCPECQSVKLEKLLSVPAAHTIGGSSLLMADLPRPCGRGGCGRPECD